MNDSSLAQTFPYFNSEYEAVSCHDCGARYEDYSDLNEFGECAPCAAERKELIDVNLALRGKK